MSVVFNRIPKAKTFPFKTKQEKQDVSSSGLGVVGIVLGY